LLFQSKQPVCRLAEIPVEPMSEVDKIKTSARTDPEKIRQYLQTILDSWPESFPETNLD
jgi:hypothetical protein